MASSGRPDRQEGGTSAVLPGLGPTAPVFAAHPGREAFFQGMEGVLAAVIRPADDHRLPSAIRVALAARMARHLRCPALIEAYDALLAELSSDPALAGIATGAASPSLGDEAGAAVRHVDALTLTPASASKDDIAALAASGLTNPQIVALTELIAFVNYQSRILHGLRLLEDRQ